MQGCIAAPTVLHFPKVDGRVLPANPSNFPQAMPQLKQRLLQVGATVLAVSMLGGYVVYSQMSQQPGQIMPGSKAKQLSPGVAPPAAASAMGGTTNAHLVLNRSKGGVFVPVTRSPGVSTSRMSATNRPPVFMYGSKSAAVVRPEALQTTPVTSNPPSHLMMPSSKVLIMHTPPYPLVTTNYTPATP